MMQNIEHISKYAWLILTSISIYKLNILLSLSITIKKLFENIDFDRCARPNNALEQ